MFIYALHACNKCTLFLPIKYVVKSLNRFYTVLPVHCHWPVAGAGFWLGGLVAGLQVGRALRCSGYLSLRSAVPAHPVPGNPTFICNLGINQLLLNYTINQL